MRRFALVVAFVLFMVFPASGALADSTSDYNAKVATAKAKVAELTTALASSKQALASLTASSATESQLLADAQTAVFEADQALNLAAGAYSSNRNAYDSAVIANNSAVDELNSAVDAVLLAGDAVDSAYAFYENALLLSGQAEAEMNTAQANYDASAVTTGGQATPGLTARVYNNVQTLGNPPQRSDTAYTLCRTTTVSNIQADWGGGSVLGCNGDYVMVHYTGYITYPQAKSVYFYAQADDGFYLTINGQPIINDWSLKGCGGNSAGLFTFEAGKSYAIDAWMYEWGGGACSTLLYQPQGSGQWTVAPASFFTQTAVAVTTKDPALKAVLDQKTAVYVSAVASVEVALTAYTDAETGYDNAMLAYSAAIDVWNVKQGLLALAEFALMDAENVWQAKSDAYSDKQTAFLARKSQFQVLFDQLKAKSLEVDNAQIALDAAVAELNAIPKPTTPPKPVKKVVSKPTPTPKVNGKSVFVPAPKP